MNQQMRSRGKPAQRGSRVGMYLSCLLDLFLDGSLHRGSSQYLLSTYYMQSTQ